MIIGQFSETYPPAQDGVGRVMLSYCQTLSQLGHRSIYIAPCDTAHTNTPECETLLYRGMKIPREPYRIGIPSLDRNYRRATKAIAFDIVHAHTPFLSGHAAIRIARRRHIPLVATFHSKYYDDFYRATHSKWLSKLGLRYVISFYRSCDEVWAVNNKTAQVLHSYGYHGDIVTMPNGANPQTLSGADYQTAMTRYPLRSGVPTLIFVGQMDYKKNTQMLLRACALIHERGVAFQLLMVGSGQDEQRLRALAKELLIDKNVIFTGFVGDRPSLLSLYRRSDLMVFPSLYDNAPMVVREAATMGTPALLLENSCSAEGITHEHNGFLCQNTPEDIAQGILSALPLAASVGKRACASIPIPWHALMPEVLARYQALIDRKREGRQV